MVILAHPTVKHLRTTLLLATLIVFSTYPVVSQDRRDIGLLGGTTYYYGEFNETTPLYQPSFALGVIFRYNFNRNYSIRASGLFGAVKGSPPQDYFLPGAPSGGFNKRVIGIEMMGEFNFIPFNPINSIEHNLTPYVNLGIGAVQMGGAIMPNIPFGIGLKYTPGSRHTIALEWRLYKTFTDTIDDYSAPVNGSAPILHNKDWYSFTGIIYTYRLYNYNNICPAYKD